MLPPLAYEFPWPWDDLRGEEDYCAQARQTQKWEAALELGADHGLVHEGFEVLAHFSRQDEVLIQAPRDYAMLHLTWAMRYDEHVRVRRLADWPAVVVEVTDMAENC